MLVCICLLVWHCRGMPLLGSTVVSWFSGVKENEEEVVVRHPANQYRAASCSPGTRLTSCVAPDASVTRILASLDNMDAPFPLRSSTHTM